MLLNNTILGHVFYFIFMVFRMLKWLTFKMSEYIKKYSNHPNLNNATWTQKICRRHSRIFIALQLFSIFVKISFGCYIVCLLYIPYIPPYSDVTVYEQFSTVYRNFFSDAQPKFKDIIVICCDFNCPTVDWVYGSDKTSTLLYFVPH